MILDANIFVSAALSSEGVCADLLRARREDRVDIAVSPLLIGEIRRALSREKFRRYVSLPDVEAFVEEMAALCRMAADPGGMTGVTRDSKDDYLVALALSEGVDAVVSGDKDLLVVDPAVVRVLKAREALREVGA